MSKPSATIVVGGAAGAIAFIAVVIGIVWFCKFHSKKFSNKNSETGSSDPSALGKFFLDIELEEFFNCVLNIDH